MFRTMQVDDWVATAQIVSFAIFACVFAAATIRALRLSKNERDHLASLPLEEREENEHNPFN
jgi:hypothetical protein